MQLANAYFIAPFFEVYGKSDYIEKANDSFYHQQFDFPKLRRLIPNSTVLYSDNDPYIDKLKSVEFREKLKSKIVRLHGLGHMGSESGMKDFPQLLDLIKQDSNIITRHDKSIR
jgi:predicted alpha/beta hydrolase family esterase